jgi:PAS domain S-box-containing protein
MHLGVITLNDSAELTYCNGYFLRLTGWARSEVIGRNWFERFVPGGDLDRRRVFASRLKSVPNSWHHENEIVCRSKRYARIRWNNSALRDAAGTVVGVMSIGEDITENRWLEHEMFKAIARERRQWAAKLHDGLGQLLFGGGLLTQGVETEALAAGMPIARELAQLASILRTALETCLQVAHEISPLIDMNGGIVHALREFTKMPDNFVPHVTLTVVEAAPLHINVVSLDHIYRVAQEACVNALKHASASSIKIHWDVQPLFVTLTVEDNGVGLAHEVVNPEHLGLKLMRYRAQMIGASLAISDGEPLGTRITLRCPHRSALELAALTPDKSTSFSPGVF